MEITKCSTIKKQDLIKERQGHIGKAAIKLFIEKGYHKTTIRDIARASGFGLGPIYNYFRSKEDIFFLTQRMVVESNYELLFNAISKCQSSSEKLKIFIETEIEIFNNNQDEYLFIYQEGHNLPLDMMRDIMNIEKKTMLMLEEILAEGQKRNIFKAFNTRVAASMIILLTHGWVLKRWYMKEDATKAMNYEFVMDLILRGILV